MEDSATSEPQRIMALYDRVMQGDAWHGDSVWTTLEGLSATSAAKRIHAGSHTIWELVLHMTFWETEVVRRTQHLAPRSVELLNFPAVDDASQGNWERALDDFRKSNEGFRRVLKDVRPEQLDQPLPARDKPLYVELHGVIQHHLYHAGQIALLRKIS